MPLSPTSTRELLRELEHFPNKKLGQNFLIDGNIVRKSIEQAEIGPGSAVVEIGPGLGTLTQAILANGAEVWAVERDAALAEHLRGQFLPELSDRRIAPASIEPGRPQADTPPNQTPSRGVSACRRLWLTEGDCLDHPLAGLPGERASSGFKIVANLPYAVSTPWMEAVLAGELPERMVLMLQKEAADRYAATHGRKTFGAISIFLQSAFEVQSRHLVAAQCFHPAPKVDSVLLRLDRKPDAIRFSPAARNCIRRIFTQRRKQLGALCKRDPEAAAAAWFDQLIANGISPTVRPEELPIPYWQGLAKRLR
ncbi:MAG: ribosomal RNA small subunit methyltransferase A [Verrucomicrobia bacterium]|jgi:16S rRNA (adenine1518-N6/adenine1519-N6)-dimethyltransferase|nr:ribosomal RNA small subunit methyltransferase A [Verrucomicrobiota bacterium]